MLTGMRRLARFPFYPLLLGVYAVLFLWSVNVGQVVIGETLRSMAVLSGLGLVVFLACLALVRSLHKAALISLALLVVLFMYGQLFALVDGLALGGVALGRHRYFIPLLALLSIGFIYLVLRARRDFRGLSPALNLLILALIVASGLTLLIPYLIKVALDQYISRGDVPGLLHISLFLAAAYLGLYLSTAGQRYLLQAVDQPSGARRRSPPPGPWSGRTHKCSVWPPDEAKPRWRCAP